MRDFFLVNNIFCKLRRLHLQQVIRSPRCQVESDREGIFRRKDLRLYPYQLQKHLMIAGANKSIKLDNLRGFCFSYFIKLIIHHLFDTNITLID